MQMIRPVLLRQFALALGCSGLLPAALAQTAPADAAGPWRYSFSLYGYLPSVSGVSRFPVDSGGTPINLSIDENLKGALMGAFEAHNGRWGVFTDAVYLELGADQQNSRDFTIGDIGLPANTSADLDWGLKGWAWTLAGTYRVLSQPSSLTLDVLAGARLLDVKQDLRWNISGNLGPIAPAARSGSAETRASQWDALVGVKGRFALGDSGRWNLPVYADIGTGESKLTWQLAGGITYAYSWGELLLMYRHLAYEMKSGQNLEDLSFSGPMIGATFRW